MSRRYKRKGKLNWPVIVAAALILSTFLISYLAMGKGIGDFFPDWEKLSSEFAATMEDLQSMAGSAGETEEPSLSSADTAQVHFIDVGQGDSMLIVCGGKTVLIDAGENDQGTAVNAYLDKLGITTLDIVIGTHPHSDHIGGLDVVLNAHKARRIILPVLSDKMTPTTRTYTDLLDAISAQGLKITPAKAGRSYKLGEDGLLTILGPLSDDYSNLNNYSVVCRFDYKNTSFLFTGDMESDVEKELLDAGANLSATVLKAGHHGSSTSTCEDFFNAVSPEICAIEVGEGNKYDHPSKSTIDLFKAAGVKIYRTDLLGSFVIETDGEACLLTQSDKEE